MASGAQRNGMGPAVVEDNFLAAVEEGKFPAGLRVLAVDDDPVSLRVLEVLLKYCKYKPTLARSGKAALQMLRERKGGEEQFDVVITDVYMPEMDGFKLLKLIGREMDLPVIMLSVNGERDSMYKGIAHGACDYLVKPVDIKELRNIWQHVVRKNHVLVNHNSNDSDDADQSVVQPVRAEGEQGGAKRKKRLRKRTNGRDGSDENNESGRRRTTRRKKPRVSWTGELHNRFLEIINRLGVDRAVPKEILKMMNVHNLTRESVASHLQKYRLYLTKITDDPRKANPLRGSSCYVNMYPQGTPCGHQEHHRAPPSSAVCVFGGHNRHAAPSALGTVGNGGSISSHAVPWLPDTGSRHASGPLAASFANISDRPMPEAFPPNHCGNAYAGVLREKLLEASIHRVVPSSHSGSSSVAEMPNGGLLSPLNQFPEEPEVGSQFSGQMYAAPSAVATRGDTQFPYLAGDSSNPWQNVVPSSFPGPMDGTALLPSQVNIPLINQLPSFGASPRQMPMFQNEEQNQMAGIINNSTQVGVFSEQMTPLFNAASNNAPVEMTNDNFAPITEMIINGGSTSSPLPNLQTGSSDAPQVQMVNGGSISSAMQDLQDRSASPTQALNGGDVSAILAVQDGPADQQAPGDDQQAPGDDQQAPGADQQAPGDDDHPTYINPNFLEETFASMQDFDDDVFLSAECYY